MTQQEIEQAIADIKIEGLTIEDFLPGGYFCPEPFDDLF